MERTISKKYLEAIEIQNKEYTDGEYYTKSLYDIFNEGLTEDEKKSPLAQMFLLFGTGRFANDCMAIAQKSVK